MAENEKDVPIKEQEDGSILAKIELPEEIEVEEEATEGKKKKKDNILLPIQDLKDQDSFEPFLKDQSLEEKDQSSKISEYEFLFSESLQKLSDNHKQVIELFLKNASQQEISNILNIPISSARTRLFYAKKKLKKIIKHHAYKSNIQLPYY